MKNRLIATSVLLFLVISISVSWRITTKGFRPHKIKIDLPLGQNDPIDEEVLEILKRKFKYIKKGSQSYVFADDEYVIKFVSMNKYREPFYRNFLSQFSIFDSYRKKRLENRNRNFKNAIRSYKIAEKYLKDETATIYFHSKKNPNLKTPIKIIDNISQGYKIDPNSTIFIIQKRAKNLKDHLLFLIRKKEGEKIKKILLSYLSLSKKILEKGFINRDSSVKNGGYIGKNLIELDLGRFYKRDKDIYTLRNHTLPYMGFLKKEAPSLVAFFEDEIKKYEMEKRAKRCDRDSK